MVRTSSRTARTYASKIDTWLLALLAGLIGTMIVGMGMSIATEGWLRFIQGAFVVFGVIGLIVWIFLGTNYTLEGRDLVIRCGPFSWRIGIDDITSIEKPSGWVRARSSAALSMDRLVVSYGKGKRVMISPAEKEKFLADLRARQKSSAQ